MHTIREPTNTPIVPVIPESLAEMALADAREAFAAWGHRPSAEQCEAIGDYLDHAKHAANGDLEPAVYLSAIPAGTGKSVAVAAFARALATHPLYRHVGALIAVNRRSEAEAMAKALAPIRDRLAVLVGKSQRDPEGLLEKMGDHSEANAAQVVVTTQELLRRALRHGADFNQAARYFYRGARRRVVLWDEHVSFNRPVVLNRYTVVKLAERISRQSEPAAQVLLEWVTGLSSQPGGQCDVPDFGSLGVDFQQLEREAATEDLAAQAAALSIMSGETGYMRRCNATGANLVSYKPELPRSLLPVLVTDASAAIGVHHASYEMMRAMLPVVRLREAPKTYRNLTIRVVPTAASRSVYDRTTGVDARNLVDMMVRYVRRVAPEPVLVVCYKGTFLMNGMMERSIRSAVEARLTEAEKDRVSFVMWGSHTATNEHTATRRVIFAGLNFLPEATAYATAGATLGRPMKSDATEDHPTGDQVVTMRRGMLRDSTLQAVLRGHARMGDDGDCGAQEVIIPQAAQTGHTDADFQGMFPECIVVRDLTLMPLKPLRGKLLEMSQAVFRRQEAGLNEIADPSIYSELGMTRQAYAKLKRKEAWGAWLASIGWHQAKLGGGVMGLRRAPV